VRYLVTGRKKLPVLLDEGDRELYIHTVSLQSQMRGHHSWALYTLLPAKTEKMFWVEL